VTIDAQILSALHLVNDKAVSAADLTRKIGITRGTLSRHISDLRSLGYEIEASPHLGYRLIRAPDLLHADDLVARLGETRVIGRDIRVFQQTTSTNNVVDKLARDSVKEGAVVFAESQTRGRGRLGRKWLSPSGKGLWFSVLLRPTLRPELVTQLTIASATALSRAIRTQTGLRPGIKWPNDILIGGKKAAGILTELKAELDTVKYVILGIGVDVNLALEDFPNDLRDIATSLRIESGRSIDRAALACAILKELDQDYRRTMEGGFVEVVDEWGAQCTTLGQDIVIQIGSRKARGRAEALDAGGALLLRTHHGHLERISGGDISLEK
jgi:BirA family biotin operon repressor/biotin-[acetyl-CoA-carboxylase] ligase